VKTRSIRILLVENNPGDVRLTAEALKSIDIESSLGVVNDGVDAMAYLRQEGRFAKSPRPDLVLLDLNLPRKDGREVLAEMKTDASLRLIPVIVLTTSSAPEDVHAVYGLHGNCFVTKPFAWKDYPTVVRSILAFWVHVAALP
jgi:CheY-like chemotaxis protein